MLSQTVEYALRAATFLATSPEEPRTVDQIAEAEAVQDALRHRLRAIERMARLSAGELSPDDEDALDQLCHSLTADMA